MKKVKRGLVFVAAGFCLLFLARFGVGYINPEAGRSGVGESIDQEVMRFAKRNFATEKFKATAVEAGGLAYDLDQKYEKVGTVFSKTAAFERDEAKLRGIISERHALVEYEQSSGLPGGRRLQLALGVVPAEFDALVQEASHVGALASIQVDKMDMTSEYKDLMAKKSSLETALNAQQSLKGKAVNVDQSINLEGKLLELEQNLQELGVKLGDYSQENQFCTVKFTLVESGNKAAISLAHRVRVALVWTIKFYALILVILFFGVLLTLAALTLAERLKLVTITALQDQKEST
ncbi:MAG TPA: DUF4349 domain-containing protein [Blastocatellia bacterium]